MTDSIRTKFVVLTTNRSGSVWVMSTLNRLPDVMAQGELFLPRARVAERRWDSDFAIPRFIETRRENRSVRPVSVFAYLNGLYSTPGAVGFKLMYAQLARYPEILAYLVARRIRVVHLVRRNHLDVVLSYAVKAKLGTAHVLQGQPPPMDLRVELDTADLVEQMEWLGRKQRIARWVLRWSGLKHMEIGYEDLLADVDHFRRIWEFLSLSRDGASPESDVVKIRSGSHREVISNYDEVSEVLANSEFGSLLA